MQVPKDFSPPMASTGIVSLPLARNAWLSTRILRERRELLEGVMHRAAGCA